MMHIDLDHPRVSRDTGEPTVPRIRRQHRVPGTDELACCSPSIRSLGATEHFHRRASLQHDLLESFVLDIQLNDGSQNRLAGFYTIKEERLLDLNGAALERLNRRRSLAGHLHGDRIALQLPCADRAHEQAQCWRSLTKFPRSPASIRARCRRTCCCSTQPVVLKGLVADWPWCARARNRINPPRYIRKFYQGRDRWRLARRAGHRRPVLL